MGVGGQRHVPAALAPGKTRIHCLGAGLFPDPVWTGEKSRPPPGFKPRTAQPVASWNTNYAIPACHWQCYTVNYLEA